METLRKILGLGSSKSTLKIYLERAKKKGPLITNDGLNFPGSYFKQLSKEDEHSISKYSKDD